MTHGAGGHSTPLSPKAINAGEPLRCERAAPGTKAAMAAAVQPHAEAENAGGSAGHLDTGNTVRSGEASGSSQQQQQQPPQQLRQVSAEEAEEEQSPSGPCFNFSEDDEAADKREAKDSDFEASDDEEEDDDDDASGSGGSGSEYDGAAGRSRRAYKKGTRMQPARRGKRGRADDHSDDEDNEQGVRRSRRGRMALEEEGEDDGGSSAGSWQGEEGQQGGVGSGDEQGDSADGFESQDAEPLVLRRELSDEEGARQLAEVWSLWEWGVVLDFLSRFRYQLAGLSAEKGVVLPPRALASELVTGVGNSGLLSLVHLELLRGITSKSDLTEHNWPAYLAARLRGWKTPVGGSGAGGGGALFDAPRGREAEVYCAMPTKQRVLLLKAVCELRADRPDIHDRIETAANPPRGSRKPPSSSSFAPARPRRGGAAAAPQQGKAAAAAVATESVSDFRLAAAEHIDASGRRYYHLDFMGSTEGLVFREGAPSDQKPLPATPEPAVPLPPRPPAAKGRGSKSSKKKATAKAAAKNLGGSRTQEQLPGSWELVGIGAIELEAAAAELTATRRKEDKRVAQWIEDDVVAVLRAREEEEERQERLRQRLSRKLGIPSVYGAANGVAAGGRRERKQVSYTFDTYDQIINDAMRRQEGRGGGGSRRGAGAEPAPPPALRLSRAERLSQRHTSTNSLAPGPADRDASGGEYEEEEEGIMEMDEEGAGGEEGEEEMDDDQQQQQHEQVWNAAAVAAVLSPSFV